MLSQLAEALKNAIRTIIVRDNRYADRAKRYDLAKQSVLDFFKEWTFDKFRKKELEAKNALKGELLKYNYPEDLELVVDMVYDAAKDYDVPQLHRITLIKFPLCPPPVFKGQ